MSKADDDEMTFVLLGRDVASPATIRFWVEERIRLGKNGADDPQIREAMECAAIMEEQSGQADPSELNLFSTPTVSLEEIKKRRYPEEKR